MLNIQQIFLIKSNEQRITAPLLQRNANKYTLYPTFSPAASPLSLEILSETRHRKGGRNKFQFRLKQEHQEN